MVTYLWCNDYFPYWHFPQLAERAAEKEWSGFDYLNGAAKSPRSVRPICGGWKVEPSFFFYRVVDSTGPIITRTEKGGWSSGILYSFFVVWLCSLNYILMNKYIFVYSWFKTAFKIFKKQILPFKVKRKLLFTQAEVSISASSKTVSQRS